MRLYQITLVLYDLCHSFLFCIDYPILGSQLKILPCFLCPFHITCILLFSSQTPCSMSHSKPCQWLWPQHFPGFCDYSYCSHTSEDSGSRNCFSSRIHLEERQATFVFLDIVQHNIFFSLGLSFTSNFMTLYSGCLISIGPENTMSATKGRKQLGVLPSCNVYKLQQRLAG